MTATPSTTPNVAPDPTPVACIPIALPVQTSVSLFDPAAVLDAPSTKKCPACREVDHQRKTSKKCPLYVKKPSVKHHKSLEGQSGKKKIENNVRDFVSLDVTQAITSNNKNLEGNLVRKTSV